MKTINFLVIILCIFFITSQTNAQLSTTASSSATALASSIVGPGITVSNETLTCPSGGSGTFSNGNSTNIGLDAGVMLASGLISNAIGPNNQGAISTSFGAAGDADLSSINGVVTRDACKLEFDFEAVANQVSISYVFGSEEYLEYVNTGFNDVFGFLVTGPNPGGGSYTNLNIATIPVNIPVTINTINPGSNSAFYINNPQGGFTTIQYDGFTVVLTATLAIVPCESYHFKLAIADGSDFILDSGVFLEEASFESSITCEDFTLTLGPDGTGSVSAADLLASDLGACTFSYSLSQSDFNCSDAGENTVTVTAEDGDGNVLTCEATVTVVVPPHILTVDLGDRCVEVYLGYGPLACATLTANVSGGNGPYTYLWSTGETTASITVCPNTTTHYSVIVTDANGCSQGSSTTEVRVVDVRCGNNGNKVLVCHIPPGNPENAHTICISPSGVPAHLAHGCYLGDCSETADPCSVEPSEFGSVPSTRSRDYQLVTEPTLWPNPGNNDLNVLMPSEAEGKVTVDLMSPEGNAIKTSQMKPGESSIVISDLAGLAPGVYLVRIIDDEGQKWMLKWLKAD